MSGRAARRSRIGASLLTAVIGLSLALLAVAVAQHRLEANATAPGGAAVELIVSSSRDAGPQTLRDAILAADRLTTRARIVVSARQIDIDSALPALVNPHGVDVEAVAGAGAIDGSRLRTGAVLQINSATTTLKGLRISGARVVGIVVNAPDVHLDSVSVTDSKVGILLNAAALGSSLRGVDLERDETGLLAEAGLRQVLVANGAFWDNTRAGFWFVSGAQARSDLPQAPQDGGGVRIEDSLFERNATGMVLANQPTSVRRSRFLTNRQGAITVLGGAVRLEDSEIRSTGGVAVSVSSASAVILTHNLLIDNASTAISVRDSKVLIERNTLQGNALGIVLVTSQGAPAEQIRDNQITQTAGDAITLIGGAAEISRNQVSENHGAALRALDLVQEHGQLKAAPHLEGNVFKGNGMDKLVTGQYLFAGPP